MDAPLHPDRRELPRETLTLLAEAVLALRATSDLDVSWDLAQNHLREALSAAHACLLRVDRRSGALFLHEESGVETPYLAENGGPVEWVMRNDRARFDESFDPDTSRETLLWRQPPEALATLPLVAGSTTYGFLLVGFSATHGFGAQERLLLQAYGESLALVPENQRDTRRRFLEVIQQECDRMAQLLGDVAEQLRHAIALLLDDLEEAPARVALVLGHECQRLAVRLEQQPLLRAEAVRGGKAHEQEAVRGAARDERQRRQRLGRLAPQQGLARGVGVERFVEARAVVAHHPLHRAAVLGQVGRLDAGFLVQEQRAAPAVDPQQAGMGGRQRLAQVVLRQVP